MKIKRILLGTLSVLTGNKLRSGLTILGIVIGVAAVIAMLSIGQGAQNSITSSIRADSDMAANAGKQHQFIFAHIPVADPSLPSRMPTLRAKKEVRGSALRSETRRGGGQVPQRERFLLRSMCTRILLTNWTARAQTAITGAPRPPCTFRKASAGDFHYLLVKISPAGVEVEVVRV